MWQSIILRESRLLSWRRWKMKFLKKKLKIILLLYSLSFNSSTNSSLQGFYNFNVLKVMRRVFLFFFEFSKQRSSKMKMNFSTFCFFILIFPMFSSKKLSVEYFSITPVIMAKNNPAIIDSKNTKPPFIDSSKQKFMML